MGFSPNGTSASAESRVVTRAPSRDVANTRLNLPENAPFYYYVDVNRLRIVKGAPLLNPVKIETAPGVLGTKLDLDDGTLNGYQSNKLGRVRVPLEFEVIAWGKKQPGYMVEKPIGADPRGKPLVHYHDVWTKYEGSGNELVRVFDQDGFDDFCRRVEKLPGVSKPHPQIVAREQARLRRSADHHRRIAHRSPGAIHEAEAIEAQLQPAS